MSITSHASWILIHQILIRSFGQAYVVSVFPVHLLAPQHSSFQLCQLEQQNTKMSKAAF